MKNWPFLAIIAGLVLLWFLMPKTEGFQSEFLDRTNEKNTDDNRVSSYKQETNHFKPTRPLEDKVPGIETPYRVNMYDSFIPA